MPDAVVAGRGVALLLKCQLKVQAHRARGQIV